MASERTSTCSPGHFLDTSRKPPRHFLGEGEYLLASDASAVIERTRRVTYLNDGEMVVVARTPSGACTYEIKTLEKNELIH